MLISTNSLIPGFKTIETIVLDNSVGYEIEKGHILSSRDLVRLSERGIDKIKVETSDEFNTFNQAFKNLIDENIKSINIDKYRETADLLKQVVLTSKSIKFNIGDYFDESKYNHIVNTVIISIILANSFNVINDKDFIIDISDMALTAMLEDIGRTCKDKYILKRISNKYSEEIKKLYDKYPSIPKTIFDSYNAKYHPVYSYLLSRNYNLSDEILTAILYHHEKEIGENSLLGVNLKEENHNNPGIIMAEIIKLADLFDILIYTNIKDNPKKPFKDISKQIDTIVASGFVSAKLTNILKKVLPLYQIGMTVELSDGTLGVVSSNETCDYAKPIITDFNGVYVDLDREKIEINRHHIV